EYLVDPSGLGNVIGQFDSTGNHVGYAYGLGLVGSVTAAGWNFFDFDDGGSTAGISGSAGDYTNRYAYDPFGTATLSTGTLDNPFQFVGQAGVMNDGNGLYFMRARFYSPELGRFEGQDPLGLNGGQAHLYEYGENSPL